VSPLWGEKPIFGPPSKTSTGMAVLCAGLPVMILRLIIMSVTNCHTVNSTLYHYSNILIFYRLENKEIISNDNKC